MEVCACASDQELCWPSSLLLLFETVPFDMLTRQTFGHLYERDLLILLDNLPTRRGTDGVILEDEVDKPRFHQVFRR